MVDKASPQPPPVEGELPANFRFYKFYFIIIKKLKAANFSPSTGGGRGEAFISVPTTRNPCYPDLYFLF